MTKQYNSEIERELHLTRLSIERVEKKLEKLLNLKFREFYEEEQKPKEVKREKK